MPRGLSEEQVVNIVRTYGLSREPIRNRSIRYRDISDSEIVFFAPQAPINYSESATVASVTSIDLSIEDIATFTESATFASVTSVTSDEEFSHIDAATIASVTTISSISIATIPSTGVLDDFNRANGAVGSNWTNDPFSAGSTPFVIDTGGVRPIAVGTYSEMYYNAQSFVSSNGLEAWITVDTIPGANNPFSGFYLDLVNTTGVSNGYAAAFQRAATDTIGIYKYVSGTPTLIGTKSNLPAQLTAGDVLTIRRNTDGTIQAYQNGVLVKTVSDSTFFLAGQSAYIGIAPDDDGSSGPAIIGSVGGGIPTPTIEVANYVDAATIASVTSVTSSEVYTPLGGAAYTESATIPSATSLTYTEIADYVETATTATVTALTTIDVAAYVETATVAGVTSITTIEIYVAVTTPLHPLLMTLEHGGLRLLRNNILNPATPAVVAYVDAATISGVTSIQSSESTDFIDTSGAIQGVSSITSAELAAYTDSNTVAGTTALTSTDVVADTEAATIASTTSLTYTEVAAYLEASTISSVTSLTSTDTTDYVEVATIASVTSLTSDEQYLPLGIPGQVTPARPLLINLHHRLGLLFGDTLSIVGPPALSYVESANISSITSLSATEVAAYVDTVTLGTSTNITTAELIADTEVASIAGTTTVITTEVANYVETATVASVSSNTTIDVANFLDANTCSSSSSITYLEGPSRLDSNTLATTTTITYTEVAAYAEQFTVVSTTTPFTVEFANYLDASVTSSITTPSGVEGATALSLDTATITSRTTLTSTDLFKILPFDLVYTAYRHYAIVPEARVARYITGKVFRRWRMKAGT